MTSPAGGPVGFVGLGNMGSVLAANLVGAGLEVVAHDACGPERTPEGAIYVPDVGEVARRAGVVVLSLPDGAASEQVAEAILAVPAAERRTTHVVDTSTIGVHAAQAIARRLASAAGVGGAAGSAYTDGGRDASRDADRHADGHGHGNADGPADADADADADGHGEGEGEGEGQGRGRGIVYVDAPVSGGVAGARARTLLVMYAGADDACAHVEPVLAGLSDRRHRVGDRPGLAQAMKLANNLLSATALAATSEAIAFGRAVGLDMATMLEVLNGASGQSAATSDKFPNHVLTGRYAAGFTNSLMAKDVQLYLRTVQEQGVPSPVGAVTASVWERFAAAQPGVDFTRIFPFVEALAPAPHPTSPSTPAPPRPRAPRPTTPRSTA